MRDIAAKHNALRGLAARVGCYPAAMSAQAVDFAASDPVALARDVKALALALGFDLAGIASAAPTPETERLRDWLARGYGGPDDGPLDYIARRVEDRVDPGRVLPGARSLLVVGLAHGSGIRDDLPEREPRIAHYARGDDYHELMLDRLRAVAAGAEVLADRSVASRAYVDTGPVLEKVFAARAGLGWAAKNTLLIHPELGSYLLLGVLVTDLELACDRPEPDHCGSCRACLDACPTDAFAEPYVLDATKCIAYSTIEDPGPIPPAQREAHGVNLFGCDLCQQVCPWNQRVGDLSRGDPLGLRARLGPREEWQRPSLEWILGLDEDAWRRATRRSALRRVKRRGLLRNALVVAGNSGAPELRSALERHADGADPLLAEHARWALDRLAARAPLPASS
jgi:epoxyqueuosine reductase